MLTQDDMEKLIVWANAKTTGWGPAFSDALSVARSLRDNVELAKQDMARPEVAKIIKELDTELAYEMFDTWWEDVLDQTKEGEASRELKLLAKSAFCAALCIAAKQE